MRRIGRSASRTASSSDWSHSTGRSGLGEGVTAEELRAAAEGHTVAHGTLVGVVAR
jgi:hypothetical protein